MIDRLRRVLLLSLFLLCILTDEKPHGSHTLCWYDCAGEEYMLMVEDYELCPLTVYR